MIDGFGLRESGPMPCHRSSFFQLCLIVFTGVRYRIGGGGGFSDVSFEIPEPGPEKIRPGAGQIFNGGPLLMNPGKRNTGTPQCPEYFHRVNLPGPKVGNEAEMITHVEDVHRPVKKVVRIHQ